MHYTMSWLVTGLAVLSIASTGTCSPCLPVIDLGYERHRAISYNSTTQLYKFQNIRYAKSPTGELRWRAPVVPDVDRETIQTGAEERTCPQAAPGWQAKIYGPVAKWSNPNLQFNLEEWEKDITNSPVPSIDMNANTTEDCLFLDVYVPKHVLETAQRTHGYEAPVLVWIHGGGNVLGAKHGTPNPGFIPSGLFDKASKSHNESMVYVALNYRLGSLGFLYGDEVEEDGDLNVGLLDQKLALNWVQDNIGLFGGNKDRVTVMGESGGAASIIYHMSTNGDTPTGLFKQAILQSPVIIPVSRGIESAFDGLLAEMNVSSLSEARRLDEDSVIRGNAAQIGAAPANTYIYTPAVDGNIVHRLPTHSLRDGKFDTSVKLLVAHNMREGAFFFDPNVKTEDDFKAWVQTSIPSVQGDDLEYIATTLYPPVFDGSIGYFGQNSRQMSFWGEAVFDCSFNLLGDSSKLPSYAYQFGVSPGVHVQDLTYTFNNPVQPAPFKKAQDALQNAVVSFVQTGVAKYEEGRPFPVWGSERDIVNITSSGGELSQSRVNTTRCAWWRDFEG